MSMADESKRIVLPFAMPDVGEEEVAEVVATLRSGWITTGPKTRQFEGDFRTYLGGGDLECVAVNSATAGLHLALEALKIGPDDEVIVPTHTFTATAEVVRYLGADPKIVDIDPATYCIDPAAIAAAIGPRTRAIMPVHYAGLAANMREIRQLANVNGLAVVEDAAHAFPTRYEGRLVGTLESDATIFSFYGRKRSRPARAGCWSRATRPSHAEPGSCVCTASTGMPSIATGRPSHPGITSIAPGYKYNLTDLAAAIGVAQLRKADAFQARRELLAERYRVAFAGLPLVMPPAAPAGSAHSWHLFVVQVGDDAGIGRDEFIERLYAAGIGCSVHYVPLHQQPYWRDRYRLVPESFPCSQALRTRRQPADLHKDERRRPGTSHRSRSQSFLTSMIKRAFDVTVALLALLVLWPFWF